MKGDACLKRVVIALLCLFIPLSFAQFSACAGGLALNAEGPSSVQALDTFSVTLIADGTGVDTLIGTVTLDDSLELVQSAGQLPAPWQVDIQVQGQTLLFAISDPTGESLINEPTRLLTLTLTAKNIGEARITVDNLKGYDANGDFDASPAMYKVTVKESTSTLLASLGADKGTLAPAFSPGIRSYKLTVPFDTRQVSLFASAQSSNSLINGAGPIAFTGQTEIVNIIVTAQDKSTATTTVTIERASEQQQNTASPQSASASGEPSQGSGALVLVILLFAVCVLGASLIVFSLLRQRKRRL